MAVRLEAEGDAPLDDRDQNEPKDRSTQRDFFVTALIVVGAVMLSLGIGFDQGWERGVIVGGSIMFAMGVSILAFIAAANANAVRKSSGES